MKNANFTIFAVILLCSAVHFGCDTGSELVTEKAGNQKMEYRYMEVDLALIAKLGEIGDADVAGGEPQIKNFLMIRNQSNGLGPARIIISLQT